MVMLFFRLARGHHEEATDQHMKFFQWQLLNFAFNNISNSTCCVLEFKTFRASQAHPPPVYVCGCGHVCMQVLCSRMVKVRLHNAYWYMHIACVEERYTVCRREMRRG